MSYPNNTFYNGVENFTTVHAIAYGINRYYSQKFDLMYNLDLVRYD